MNFQELKAAGSVQLYFLKAPCSDSNAISGVSLDVVGFFEPFHPIHSHPTYIILFDPFCDFWCRRKGPSKFCQENAYDIYRMYRYIFSPYIEEVGWCAVVVVVVGSIGGRPPSCSPSPSPASTSYGGCCCCWWWRRRRGVVVLVCVSLFCNCIVLFFFVFFVCGGGIN